MLVQDVILCNILYALNMILSPTDDSEIMLTL